MLDFMDYIQLAFSDASGWNRDNSYASLTDTAKAILDFSTPERLRVNLSSLSTPQFATTYSLGTVGLIDGSVSYLFTTLPLDNTQSRSTLIPLRHLVPGYRQIYPPSAPLVPGSDRNLEHLDPAIGSPSGEKGTRGRKPTLLHATLHLPPPTTLTALFLHRPSPTTQLSLALWSTQASSTSKSAPPQASLLTRLCHDTGKYSSELLFSTDNALLGFKGLWNFGPDPRKIQKDGKSASQAKGNSTRSTSQSVSLLSAGGEAYYSPVSSVIGLSTGLRFTTLPAASESTSTSHAGTPTPSPISTFPYTLTLTLTPLTGTLSTTYSLLASPNLAFSSRFGFNVYSWESEMVAGCELWRRKRTGRSQNHSEIDNLAWAKKKMGLVPVPPDSPLLTPTTSQEQLESQKPKPIPSSSAEDSVIKVRLDQSWNLRFLWEGHVKELLVSAGVALGPLSCTSSYGSSASWAAGGSQKGYGWTGVGVSVLYSS